ncbi:unnamed protein product [Soboliphyme baturini]|uniref:Pept_C1 domain-containing protein n=1 Tax=Soboliphyme baturini TaxID=241478 RepID=A0A183I9J8_9BILA|nr:unnamed protein product [Soboliphyme baturini]
MFSILLLLAVSSTFAAHYEEEFLKMKSHLSKMRADMNWEFGLNSRFNGMSEEEMRQLNGDNFDASGSYPVKEVSTLGDLPESFDARQKWPKCQSMRLIRDQSKCGSCWAVSSASVMSDRQCVISDQEDQTYISDEYLLSCCPNCGSGYKYLQIQIYTSIIS